MDRRHSHRPQHVSNDGRDRRHSHRPQHVLIAEDSQDIRELWKAWLGFWGFEVEEAANGLEAVQKATAHPPDLVLMDLWMPVIDGIEATERLKAHPSTAHVPVLALSAQSMVLGEDRAEAAGCEAFIQKPVDPDSLLGYIRAAMHERPQVRH